MRSTASPTWPATPRVTYSVARLEASSGASTPPRRTRRRPLRDARRRPNLAGSERSVLLDDGVAQMADGCALDAAEAVQADVAVAEVVDQPGTGAQK